MSDVRELEGKAIDLPESDVVLMARIVKAIADVERVAEFKIHVCDDDCKVHIRTTWGTPIDHYQPRPDWRHAVRKALDDLDEIKPGIEPSTNAKE